MHKIQHNCSFAYNLPVSPILSLILISLGRPSAPRKGTRGAQLAMIDGPDPDAVLAAMVGTSTTVPSTGIRLPGTRFQRTGIAPTPGMFRFFAFCLPPPDDGKRAWNRPRFAIPRFVVAYTHVKGPYSVP